MNTTKKCKQLVQFEIESTDNVELVNVNKLQSIMLGYDNSSDNTERVKLLLATLIELYKTFHKLRRYCDNTIELRNGLLYRSSVESNDYNIRSKRGMDPREYKYLTTDIGGERLTLYAGELLRYRNRERIQCEAEKQFSAYCKRFVDARDTLVAQSWKGCKLVGVKAGLSVLLASQCRNRWRNCKSVCNHWYGINGNFFNCNTDRLNHIVGIVRSLRCGVTGSKSERISVKCGERIIGSSTRLCSVLSCQPGKDRLSVTRSKYERLVYVLSCSSRQYVNRLGNILTTRTTPEHTDYLLSDERLRSLHTSQAVIRLTRITASRLPYVATIPASKPVQIGVIRVYDQTVPVYEIDCWIRRDDTRSYNSTIKNSSYTYRKAVFIGNSANVVVQSIVSKVDWYHYGIGGGSAEANDSIRTMQSRVDHELRYKPRTEAEIRKEIAATAIKLLQLRSINMLDSKAVGNCLPGTREFARQLGLPIPNEWTDFKFDSRIILRAWKQAKYNSNSLFYKLVNETHAKLIKQTVQLTAFY